MSFGTRRILPSVVRDGEVDSGEVSSATSSDTLLITIVYATEQEIAIPKEADTIVSVTPAP